MLIYETVYLTDADSTWRFTRIFKLKLCDFHKYYLLWSQAAFDSWLYCLFCLPVFSSPLSGSQKRTDLLFGSQLGFILPWRPQPMSTHCDVIHSSLYMRSWVIERCRYVVTHCKEGITLAMTQHENHAH